MMIPCERHQIIGASASRSAISFFVRSDTQAAAFLLALGVVANLTRSAVNAVFFDGPQMLQTVGDGAMGLAGAAALWAVISVHLLPDDKKRPLLWIDGLTAVGAVAWLFTLMPVDTTVHPDELAYVYLPASMAAVPLSLAARHWWPTPTRSMLLRRLAALTSACVILVGVGKILR